MFEFLIASEKKTKVFLKNVSFFVDEQKNKKLIVENENLIEFEYFYADELSCVYPAKIVFENERWVSKSKNLDLIKISNNFYICKICSTNCCFFEKKCKKIAKNGLFFNFYQNGTVEIEDENNLLFCENFDFETCDATLIELDKNYYAINLFSKNNQEKTILINQSFSSDMTFDNAIFEKKENGFKVLKEQFDIANHGIVETYCFDDGIKKENEYTVYFKNHALNAFNPQILPIYFLQCVKVNDFSEAKKCLGENLTKKISNHNLKSFFGNFAKIFPFENKIYLLYNSKKSQNFDAKNCNFLLKNNKIEKIDLI